MNNMGGYRSVELLFTDEIETFSVSGDMVNLVRTNDGVRRLLPMHDEGVSLSASPNFEEGGCVWSHSARIQLISAKISDQLDRELQTLHRRGCVLVGTTTNGQTKVYGSKEYPLRGTYHELDGTRRSDLHCHEMELSCRCLHPALLA